MSASDTLALARARRTLRRASRLWDGERAGDALELAVGATRVLRGQADRDPARRGEFVTSMLVVVEGHLRSASLHLAVDVLNEVVTLLESAPLAEDDADDAADRLADVLTRRGDTWRLLADHRAAACDLARALTLASSPLHRAGAHNALGILAKDMGSHDEAAAHYAAALEGLLGTFGCEHPALADVHHNLAGLAHARGRFVEGEALIVHALELRSGTSAADSAEVAADLALLGAVQSGQGRLDEAESTFVRTLEMWTRLRGPSHYEVAVSLHHLAALHLAGGDRQSAATELRRALRIKQNVLGSEHPEVLTLTDHLDRAVHR